MNNNDLNQLFLQHYSYCVRWLQKRYACSKADAEDLTMDAFLKFKERVQKGNFEQDNIRGYITMIAKNLWLQNQRKTKAYAGTIALDIDKVEYYLSQKEGLYEESFNPLVKQERLQETSQQEKQQINAYTSAWKKLGKKCQELLKAFLLDKIGLKELQHRFGYGNYNSIKSTKKRCWDNLKREAQQQLK